MKIDKKYSNLEKVELTFSRSEVEQALEEYAEKHFQGWTGKLPDKAPTFDWWEDGVGDNGGDLMCSLTYLYSNEVSAVPSETPDIEQKGK